MSDKDTQTTECLHCKLGAVLREHCTDGKVLRIDVHEIAEHLGAVMADVLGYSPPEFHMEVMASFHVGLAEKLEGNRERAAATAAMGKVTVGSVN